VFGGTTASLAIVAADLTDPVYVTSPPGDDRLFVVEKEGQIIVIKNGATLATPFLDLSSKVITTSEMGLLSVAFHPNFAQNHQLYVLYNLDEGGNVERVARFTVSANADVADAGSETVILETPPRSTDYHNGGLLQFGPDGKLYVGFGDAGTSSNAQSLASLHGKILRLDVDGGSPYAIPIDNPFRGQSGARGEIWEYGFRNPWRYSFDSQTGDLYIADVGEDNVEEVDALLALTPAGRNFGWPVMEGNTCYLAQSCNQTGLTQPVLTYTHAEGCAVVGGYVYRGRGIRELTGQYLYSDLCGGFIRSFTYVNGVVASRHDWTAQLGGALSQVSSFGQDWRGELYITTLGAGTGTLYKFVPAD
jgi:glucose/arabinose dehydrogenase